MAERSPLKKRKGVRETKGKEKNGNFDGHKRRRKKVKGPEKPLQVFRLVDGNLFAKRLKGARSGQREPLFQGQLVGGLDPDGAVEVHVELDLEKRKGKG